MASKSGGASGAHQGSNQAGKRRGLKLSGGQSAKPGQIIMRQKGTVLHPGTGVGMGRDFTIFAKKHGVVSFSVKKKKKLVSVV